MSRTFSTNSGSLDSLNVSWRCGCKPKARQMRATAVCTRAFLPQSARDARPRSSEYDAGWLCCLAPRGARTASTEHALETHTAAIIQVSEQHDRARPSGREVAHQPHARLQGLRPAAVTIAGVELLHRFARDSSIFAGWAFKANSRPRSGTRGFRPDPARTHSRGYSATSKIRTRAEQRTSLRWERWTNRRIRADLEGKLPRKCGKQQVQNSLSSPWPGECFFVAVHRRCTAVDKRERFQLPGAGRYRLVVPGRGKMPGDRVRTVTPRQPPRVESSAASTRAPGRPRSACATKGRAAKAQRATAVRAR